MSLQDNIYKLKREFVKGNVNPRVVIGIAFIAIAIMGIASYALFSADPSQAEDDEPQFKIVDSALAMAESAPQLICIHVSGCVTHPGVVYVESGKRVSDAIEAAGGFSDGAAQDSINLARVLEDGEQIHIASMAEYQALNAPTANSTDGSGTMLSQNSMSERSDTRAGLININKATSSELQTLSGIGEAKAKKIIDYREANGAFKSVDDLTKVSGIGEKTLESIRSSICV